MNNPVQLVAADPTPLEASPSALEALNESQNIKVWLCNELTSYTTRSSLAHEDIAHKIKMIMGIKLVSKMHNRLVETSYGMAHHHAMTKEPIAEDFDLVYIYNVDTTDAGTQGYLHSQAGPSVRIIKVERTVSPPVPTSVHIRVDKDVVGQIEKALGAIKGSWLRTQKAIYIDPQVDVLSDPELQKGKTELNNFLSQMDIRLDAAANSLIRGQNALSFMTIVEQSPSVTTLPKNKRFKNVHDRRDLVRRMISIVPQMSFGLNKIIPGNNSDRNSPHKLLDEVLRIFDLHTDTSGAIDGLDGWFEGSGAPFRTPDVIAMTTERVIENLYNMGIVHSSTVDMNQVLTQVSLHKADMLPINTTAPQRSIHTRKWGYMRDPNEQLVKHIITTANHKINHARVGKKNVVFVAVDDGGMSENIAQESGLTTLTTFDFALPTGVCFTHNGATPHGPTRQWTNFTNETGARYTLSCEQLKAFLTSFFTDECTSLFDFKEMKDADTAKACMLFFDTPKDYLTEENEEAVLRRNVYMRNNYYYNNDLMAHNIISVMLNRTTPALRPMFERAAANVESESEERVKRQEEEELARTTSDSYCQSEVDREFDMGLVKAIVENYMTKRRLNFDNDDFEKIYNILYHLTNCEAIEYLGFINMGFGVVWLKPMHVQADSILFSRPSGYAHFGGTPTQHRKQDLSDESNSVLFQSVAYSTTSRQSLAQYPSVMWNNASYVESVTLTTNSVIDVTDPSAITDALNHLHTTAEAGTEQKTFDKEIRGDGWWPLFCPPFMDIESMSKPFNPLGRMGTPFKSEEEHAQKFTDITIMDVIHPNVYTTNAVHQDMWNNINTVFLYNVDLFHNRDFPFYKYMNFSPHAEEGLTTTENAITRDVNRSINMKRSDAERVSVKGESAISDFAGVAIPKTCWSDSGLDGVVCRDDFKTATSYRVNAILINGDTSFYVNGDDFVGKWDRCGVSEYSFLS